MISNFFHCLSGMQKAKRFFVKKNVISEIWQKLSKKVLRTMFTVFENPVLWVLKFFMSYFQVSWQIYKLFLIWQKPDFTRFLESDSQKYKFINWIRIQFWLDFRRSIILENRSRTFREIAQKVTFFPDCADFSSPSFSDIGSSFAQCFWYWTIPECLLLRIKLIRHDLIFFSKFSPHFLKG